METRDPAPGVPDLDALSLRRRHRFDLEIPGEAAKVPLTVLVGASHHPCLGLVSGVHGDEYDGILALHDIAREADTALLRGTLLIVHVANPLAFAAGQRRSPGDDRDLNRTFPGDPDGSSTERLAHLLSRELLSQADAVFSLHGASTPGTLSPCVEFLDIPNEVGACSYDMALASGFPDLMALDERPGRLLRAMGDLGVPLIEGEVGGRGTTRWSNVEMYKSAVYSVARHAGVLPPRVEGGDEGDEPSIWQLSSVEAEADGLFLRDVALKQAVRTGDRLGRIVDLRGETVLEVCAPDDGAVGGYREHLWVRAGDSVVTLWLPVAQTRVETSRGV